MKTASLEKICSPWFSRSGKAKQRARERAQAKEFVGTAMDISIAAEIAQLTSRMVGQQEASKCGKSFRQRMGRTKEQLEWLQG